MTLLDHNSLICHVSPSRSMPSMVELSILFIRTIRPSPATSGTMVAPPMPRSSPPCSWLHRTSPLAGSRPCRVVTPLTSTWVRPPSSASTGEW